MRRAVHQLARQTVRALGAFAIAAPFAFAPRAVPAQVADIAFSANANPLTLPDRLHFGEVTGIDLDQRRHVYVFMRTGVRSTVHGGVASQLFEFGPDGKFIRESARSSTASPLPTRCAWTRPATSGRPTKART